MDMTGWNQDPTLTMYIDDNEWEIEMGRKIITTNNNPLNNGQCTHNKTYVSVRHVSGLKVVRCSLCNKVV